MIQKEEMNSMRYLMYFLAALIVVIRIFVALNIGFAESFILNTLLIIATMSYTLLIACIHPKYHRIIVIPLIILTIYGLSQDITQFINLYSFLNWTQLLTFFFSMGSSLLASIATIYMFAKKKMYHFSDFIILGFLLITLMGGMLKNIYALMSIIVIEDIQISQIMLMVFTNMVAPILSFALLVLYVLEAKRLFEQKDFKETLIHSKKNDETMNALTKLYRDGHLTWNEYEEKKRQLKSESI